MHKSEFISDRGIKFNDTRMTTNAPYFLKTYHNYQQALIVPNSHTVNVIYFNNGTYVDLIPVNIIPQNNTDHHMNLKEVRLNMTVDTVRWINLSDCIMRISLNGDDGAITQNNVLVESGKEGVATGHYVANGTSDLYTADVVPNSYSQLRLLHPGAYSSTIKVYSYKVNFFDTTLDTPCDFKNNLHLPIHVLDSLPIQQYLRNHDNGIFQSIIRVPRIQK